MCALSTKAKEFLRAAGVNILFYAQTETKQNHIYAISFFTQSVSGWNQAAKVIQGKMLSLLHKQKIQY